MEAAGRAGMDGREAGSGSEAESQLVCLKGKGSEVYSVMKCRVSVLVSVFTRAGERVLVRGRWRTAGRGRRHTAGGSSPGPPSQEPPWPIRTATRQPNQNENFITLLRKQVFT